MQKSHRPTRVREVIEQSVDDEVVVYRLADDEVHLLNSTTAAVWRHCDGESTIDDIAARVGLELGSPIDNEVVWAALAELDRAGLLVDHVDAPRGLSRRQLMKRLAVAAVAIPVVTSIVAPSAAAAASGCAPDRTPCSSDTECCSTVCDEVCIDP